MTTMMTIKPLTMVVMLVWMKMMQTVMMMIVNMQKVIKIKLYHSLWTVPPGADQTIKIHIFLFFLVEIVAETRITVAADAVCTAQHRFGQTVIVAMYTDLSYRPNDTVCDTLSSSIQGINSMIRDSHCQSILKVSRDSCNHIFP